MKKIYLLIPFLLLTACVATGVSQPSKFYNLQSADTGAYTNSRIRGNVGVMEITLADYLDKPQIVTTKPNMIELDISENNRWSESLSTMIQRVMADDLAYYLPKAAVKPRTSARENFNYLVQIELNKFDGSWNKNVVLEAWWSIKNASGQVIRQQKTVLSAPLGNGYDDLVKVQSRLLSDLAEKIARSL